MIEIKTICCGDVLLGTTGDQHLSGSEIVTLAKLRGISLAHADLRNLDLRGMDFRWADLSGATLNGSRLQGCDFRNADIENTDFSNSYVAGAKITHSCWGCQPSRNFRHVIGRWDFDYD